LCQHLLEDGVVEDLLGQQLLQLAVLVFERLEALRARDLETAVLRVPGIEGR
jgi:hypothetical protein